MMRIPRMKDLKSKLFSAKLLGVVVKNSLTFKLKRGAMPRFRATEFDTVIVDMDGTLYRTDANLEALAMVYNEILDSGRPSGEELYNSLISKIASGEYSIEKGIVEGNKFLMAKKVGRRDFERLADIILPSIRKPLIKSLLSIKESGKTAVLATLSSRAFGEILNRRIKARFGFSFDHVVGTELNFDDAGQICGISSIVGTKDFNCEGIPVRSKLAAVKAAIEASGKKFDPKKSVLITDSYGDIDLAKMLVTILIKQHNPTTAQKVSYSLNLADYVLQDNRHFQTNLESIILGSEKTSGPAQ